MADATTQGYPPPQPGEKPPSVHTKPVGRRPWGLRWRSSIWFVTLVVGIAITTDLLIYSMIVPIIPFRLQELGYDGVSGLVGWLLFAYSAALVVFTPPIAFLSERHKNRKVPLLLGQAALIGSQVLLMEAPKFWVMAVARIAQGISASVIWVVGLALICDTVPERIVGKQLGLAMMGMSLGFLIGPPVAGALDERFGFRGPFIFGVIVTAVELIGRLLIIERQEAIRWDAAFTTLVPHNNASQANVYGAMQEEKRENQPVDSTQVVREDGEDITEAPTRVPSRTPSRTATAVDASVGDSPEEPSTLSIVGLFLKLAKSPRALSAVFLTLTYGIMISSLEPVLPLYLQAEYGLDVSKVGLVYIAAVVPSFFSAPISGWYADRGGTIISTVLCLLGSLPFWCLIIIRSHLAYFIVMFALLNLFATGTISPVTAEFASVTRSLQGVGYGHVYGAFNVAYGLGSARNAFLLTCALFQLYDHVTSDQGWLALCLFNAGLVVVSAVATVCYFGEIPALQRVIRWTRRRREGADEGEASA
ncbi:MFS general substrate transporter [Trametes maxima]|nr:MFS general substrate transporter [Trametes maxima]